MNLVELLARPEDIKYNSACKYACSIANHSIYCKSLNTDAPRKCTYRMCEDRMSECKFFKEQKLKHHE